jgi:hypothetical protein
MATADYDGKHEVGDPVVTNGDPLAVEVTVAAQPVVLPSALNYLKYFAKAIAAALTPGLVYLLTVLGPAASVGDITFLQWLGFILSIVAPGGVVAAVANGAKPSNAAKG